MVTLIYTNEFLKKKIKKICDLYDLTDPVDLFTMLPQEMELAEVRKMVNKDFDKKEAVMSVIMGVANKKQIDLPKEWAEVFIDTIDKASKGAFAINKEDK